MLQAVLTGDIVNSTLMNEAREKKLANSLKEVYTDHKMEFFRGDSFQAYVKDPKQALRLALLSRTLAISLFKDDITVSDIRISIGLGTVHLPVRSLNTARGEAFILSGRSFDDISKSGQRLAIVLSQPLANEGMQVIADYLNIIFEGMSSKQAEVIYELLKGEMQKSVARKLKKTKSTIHQRMTAGRWPEIEKLLQRYENIINLLI
jgi:hypothetical protein